MADDVGDVPLAPDRPDANVLGEFNRKMGAMESRLNAVVGYIEQQQGERAAPPAAAKRGHAGLSNDELWELAKAGDKAAFDLHQKRNQVQTYTEMRGAENQQQLVTGQLAILQQKYPVLASNDHALTQTANVAYNLLVRRGYPTGDATRLEAVKTAVADRPDLIAEMYTQSSRAREGARRVSAGNPGQTGATIRNDPPPVPGSGMRVSVAEAALAKRMGVADPAGAKTRFLQRQDAGNSSLGSVASMLTHEEF